MVTLSEVGATADDVKSYIQELYDTNGLTFILLVGDANEMPYTTGTVGNVVGEAADPRYALLAGNDSYPDAFVSRFPAQTSNEVSIMVNRVINYEKSPMTGAGWYHLGVGIASDEGTPTDHERMDWLHADLTNYTYTSMDEIYDPGASASQVSSALNAGRGIVNYIGHGMEINWVTTGFSVSDVYALINTNMVPFIFSVACVNGRFNRSGGDCFAEAWLKVGSPDAPKGALGIYASSTDQDWVPPCDAQGESIDRLVDDSYRTLGGLCFNGVMKGLDNHPGTTGEQLFQQWHIFGDCSAMVFTDTPTTMSVSHDGSMWTGQTTYAVSVGGITNALCALYNETTHVLHGSAYTDIGGYATITLDPVPSEAMTLILTVTAFNREPYQGTSTVAAAQSAVVQYASHSAEDDNDDDGRLEPGETALVKVVLRNIGNETATNVSATLTNLSSYLTVTNATRSYGNVASGQTVTNATSYSVNIATNCPQVEHTLRIMVQSDNGAWTNTFQLSIETNLAPMGTPEWWLLKYGLTNEAFSVEELKDTDGDGMLAWQEWVAGTDPTNVVSLLAITNFSGNAESGFVLHWHSVSGRIYYVYRATNLIPAGFSPLATNTASPPVNVYTAAPGVGDRTFYRIKVEKE